MASMSVRQSIAHSSKVVYIYISCLALGYLSSFASVWVITQKFKEINGWSFGEISLVYLICLISSGISTSFFSAFRSIGSKVENGSLDLVLIKPLNPLLNLMGTEFRLAGLGNIIAGLIVLIGFRNEIAVKFTLINCLLFIIAVLGGALIHGGLLLIIGAMSTKFVRINGIDDIYSAFRDFSNYPVVFYNRVIQFVMYMIIPMAFASYVPAGMFLDNNDYNILPKIVWYLSPLVGVLYFSIAYMFWVFILRKYESTGS